VLKVIYMRLETKKFLPGAKAADPHFKAKEKGREREGEGRGGEKK
jgi:hypothetical protein